MIGPGPELEPRRGFRVLIRFGGPAGSAKRSAAHRRGGADPKVASKPFAAAGGNA